MTIIHIFNLALTDSRILATILGQYGATTLVRLNGNGSLDNAFATVSTPAPIFTGDDNMPSYALQPDGKISACGSFRAIAGQVRIGRARLTNPVATATRAGTSAPDGVPQPHQPAPHGGAAGRSARHAGHNYPGLTGRAVRRWALLTQQAEATFDLSAAAAGVYVLRIPGTAGGAYQQKVVVPR